MQINQLMDKAEQGQYEILLNLYKFENSINVKNLAIQTDLSKVTLLKYIDIINTAMADNKLEVSISVIADEVSLNIGQAVIWNEILTVFLKQSCKFQLLLYLFKRHEFTIPALSQYLLISEATLNRHLSSLNKSLKEFKISVSQGRLLGEESDIRYFYFRLFWQVFTKEELEKFLENYETKKIVTFIESVIDQDLNLEQRYKLQLWYSISQQRLRNNKKKFVTLFEKMKSYKDNEFFNKIENFCFLNFSNYSVEIDRGEVMSLFAFITSNSILSLQYIEDILEFVNPISKKITEVLGLKRKVVSVEEVVNKKIVYTMGQVFYQKYFFNGTIEIYSEEDALLRRLTQNQDYLVKELYNFAFDNFSIEELGEKTELELRKLILFIKSRKKEILKVAVDIDDTSLNQELWIKLIKERLNNKMIELYSIDKVDKYDCVISAFVHSNYENDYVYKIKQGFTERELADIVLFLKDNLSNKNKDIIL